LQGFRENSDEIGGGDGDTKMTHTDDTDRWGQNFLSTRQQSWYSYFICVVYGLPRAIKL